MSFINFTKSKNVFKSRITNNIFLPLLASIHHTDKMKKNIHTCVYRAKYRLSSRCVFKLFYCSLPMHENPTPFPLRCAKKEKEKENGDPYAAPYLLRENCVEEWRKRARRGPQSLRYSL